MVPSLKPIEKKTFVYISDLPVTKIIPLLLGGYLEKLENTHNAELNNAKLKSDLRELERIIQMGDALIDILENQVPEKPSKKQEGVRYAVYRKTQSEEDENEHRIIIDIIDKLDMIKTELEKRIMSTSTKARPIPIINATPKTFVLEKTKRISYIGSGITALYYLPLKYELGEYKLQPGVLASVLPGVYEVSQNTTPLYIPGQGIQLLLGLPISLFNKEGVETARVTFGAVRESAILATDIITNSSAFIAEALLQWPVLIRAPERKYSGFEVYLYGGGDIKIGDRTYGITSEYIPKIKKELSGVIDGSGTIGAQAILRGSEELDMKLRLGYRRNRGNTVEGGIELRNGTTALKLDINSIDEPTFGGLSISLGAKIVFE